MLKKVSKKDIVLTIIFVIMPFGTIAAAVYFGKKIKDKRKNELY
jgi:hypothetical protein